MHPRCDFAACIDASLLPRSFARMSSRSWPRWLLILVCCCLTGCNEPRADFFVVVPNANDVVTGSPVMWRGETVGAISAIEPVEKGVRLEATLTPAHRERLRADLRAAPIKSARTGDAPVLEIYGGTNPKAPKIQRGQQVRTEGLLERAGSLLGSRDIAVIAVAVVLLVVFFFLRGMLKVLSLIAAAAFCALAFSFIRAKWSDDGSADFEARVAGLADQAIKSPAATEVWRRIQKEMAEWTQPKASEVDERLGARVEELRKAGEAVAAGEVEQLRKKLRE